MKIPVISINLGFPNKPFHRGVRLAAVCYVPTKMKIRNRVLMDYLYEAERDMNEFKGAVGGWCERWPAIYCCKQSSRNTNPEL